MKKSIVLMILAALSLGAVACKDKAANGSSTTTASKSSGVVAEYEKFVDEYIVIYKKMKAGDANAMQEYQKLAEKAQEWSTKFQNITPAEAQQCQKIAEKLTKAMQE